MCCQLSFFNTGAFFKNKMAKNSNMTNVLQQTKIKVFWLRYQKTLIKTLYFFDITIILMYIDKKKLLPLMEFQGGGEKLMILGLHFLCFMK
jgi:glucan phosphoethanolaminetransferase (alkaline phosphatase superfamily)